MYLVPLGVFQVLMLQLLLHKFTVKGVHFMCELKNFLFYSVLGTDADGDHVLERKRILLDQAV